MAEKMPNMTNNHTSLPNTLHSARRVMAEQLPLRRKATTHSHPLPITVSVSQIFIWKMEMVLLFGFKFMPTMQVVQSVVSE